MHGAAPDDPPPPSWRQRPRPIGIELAYRLEGETLVIDTGRKVEVVRLNSVERVRYSYAPSNVSAHGFRTELRLPGGRTIGFGNLSWRSLTDMDRDDAGYHRFVSALAAAITKASPTARFEAGRPYPIWLAVTLVGVLSLAMLAYFTLRAFSNGSNAVGLLGLFLLAASFWQVSPMIRLNRPRVLASGDVPPDLVPGGGPG